MGSDVSALKSPISKTVLYIWLYLSWLFPASSKNIHQLVKMGDKLQKAATWFSLDWLQQIYLLQPLHKFGCLMQFFKIIFDVNTTCFDIVFRDKKFWSTTLMLFFMSCQYVVVWVYFFLFTIFCFTHVFYGFF